MAAYGCYGNDLESRKMARKAGKLPFEKILHFPVQYFLKLGCQKRLG
jgi:hypothetical protein